MAIDIERMRARLECELAELQQHIKNQREEYHIVDEIELPEEEDFKEAASRMLEREIVYAIFANELLLMDKMQTALKHIKEGTYGYCRRCGQPIPEKRLIILPWADLCVKDQSNFEKTYNDHNAPSYTAFN